MTEPVECACGGQPASYNLISMKRSQVICLTCTVSISTEGCLDTGSAVVLWNFLQRALKAKGHSSWANRVLKSGVYKL